MGGLLVIIVVIVIFLVLRWPPQGGVIAPLATLAFVGLLGRRRRLPQRPDGRGHPAPARSCCGRSVVALVVAYQIQNTYQITGIRVPFVGDVVDRPARLHLLRRVRDRGRRPTASTSPTASTASRAGRSCSPSSRS